MTITIDSLKLEIQVKLPRIPNFLLTDDDNVKFHIGEFSKKELRKIGNLWLDEFVSRGKD